LTPRRISAVPPSLLRAVALAALLFAAPAALAAPGAAPDPAAAEIARRLDPAAAAKIDAETLDIDQLRAFYQSRKWKPAWADQADKIMTVLSAADLEGLPAGHLHLKAINARRPAATPTAAAELDLLITDAALRYAADMRGLRADPREIEDDWFLSPPSFAPEAFLKENTRDLGAALIGLQPPYAGYQLLRQHLARLHEIAAAGDWPKVPAGPTIKPGDTDDRVMAVRKRLEATGELASGLVVTAVYDDELQAAVKLFQQRHGLTDDGALGRQTVAAMNISAADRARQVAVNMERWRWLPAKLEDTHIVVNVPGQWLEVVEDGKAVLTMRTVVGDPDHPTPALHARLNSLVLNPVWRVPASIATKEILPKLKKDPGYLVANDLEIVSDSFPVGSPESQGVGFDWKSYKTFPWPLRQQSGSDNALGRIKFNIPNDDDIYLHDTPNHKAFLRAARALSHGCVRLERPDDLALYLLRDKDWNKEKLDQQIEDGETRTVSVGKPIPVWLLYWTSWVDGDGVLQLRDDIYGRDQRLAEALAHPEPPAHEVAATVTAPTTVTKAVCEGCRVP